MDDVNRAAQHAHSIQSIMFIRELNRMFPRESRSNHARPQSCAPVASPALHGLRLSIEQATHLPSARSALSPYRALDALSKGHHVNAAVLMHSVVPAHHHHDVPVATTSRVYGARFVGAHADRFVVSSKDRQLTVFDTRTPHHFDSWRRTHAVRAHAVRWTITDFDVSPDGRWLAYASIHSLVHVVDLDNPADPQRVLDFAAAAGDARHHRLNIWSLKWGHDGRELIVGTGAVHLQCAGTVIVYDVDARAVVDVIAAHEDDVNAVAFLQTGDCNMLLSASDDGLVKMWDRRSVRAARPRPAPAPLRTCGAAAVFVGHQLGLTFVSPKDDGRFFLSNGKDQYIKLWDARRSTAESDLSNICRPPRDDTFDYRVQTWPRLAPPSEKYQDDSVMSYAGAHETLQTLIRAHFSPVHTTGQRYIYCGSSDGQCVVYDVLSGKCVCSLSGQHTEPVRDVSWHPYGNFLTAGSFDGRVSLWTTQPHHDESERRKQHVDDDDDDDPDYEPVEGGYEE